jgi:hypothetical protein
MNVRHKHQFVGIASGSCMKCHTIAYSRGEVDKASP